MWRLLVISFLAVLCLFPGTDARAHCWRIWVALGDNLETNRKFWEHDEPAVVSVNGANLPFAFGFDAELWHLGDILKLIHLDPASEALAIQTYKDNLLVYDRSSILRFLDATEENLNGYLLEGSRKKTALTLFDIDPVYWVGLKHNARDKTAYSNISVVPLKQALAAKGIPVSAKWERSSGETTQGPLGSGSALELIMDGSISEPKKFADLIHGFLHKNTDEPETHYHVSIPVAAVTGRQMMLAARAVEMKITLEETLLQLHYDGSLAPYDVSALALPVPPDGDGAYEVQRGVVRVTPRRWDTPVRAHDVEIRQWLDADHALENMRFMMELVKKAPRLRDTSAFKAGGISGISPANLPSSLEYAAYLLKDRLPSDKAYLSDKLTAFATEIRAAGSVSTEKRDEIAAFIKREDLLRHITLETFLEPEVKPAPTTGD